MLIVKHLHILMGWQIARKCRNDDDDDDHDDHGEDDDHDDNIVVMMMVIMTIVMVMMIMMTIVIAVIMMGMVEMKVLTIMAELLTLSIHTKKTDMRDYKHTQNNTCGAIADEQNGGDAPGLYPCALSTICACAPYGN